jgi:WD40 repeat protein
VVDQFEELFTLVEDEPARQRFIDGLVAALVDPHSQLRVVCTLRADFWDRPLRYGELARLLDGSAVPVMPLQPDELERAIVDPAHALGAEFEPGLVSEIVADVADQPGALPMLQYALTELWERRVSGLLTRDAYRKLGGVTGALAATAERLYESSSEAEQAATRRLFGRLVTLGEGVEDTRRRVLRTELGADPALDAVLERFGTARLLSFDRDPASREQTLEVAHEALLREWPRLRTWLLEDRDGLRILRHLTAATAAWEASGSDAGELYRGGRLEAAETWAAEHGGELNDAERAFLAASVQRRGDEQAAERRQLRRLRGALVGVGVVAVVAVVAGLLALRQQGRADREATRAGQQASLASASAAEAETRRMVADAAAIVGENRDVALLLASEAYRREPGPRTLAGLQRVLTSTGAYLGTIGAGVDHLAGGWLDDGTIVGVTKDDVRFYDPDTWALTGTVPLPAPMFNPSSGPVPVQIAGDSVLVGTERGSLLVAAPDTSRVVPVSAAPIRSIAAGPGTVAVGDTDGVVHLLDRSTGTVRWSAQVLPERSFREVMGEEAWAGLDPVRAGFIASFEPVIFGAGPAALVLADDGAVIAGAGTSLRRLDPTTGQVTASLLMQTTTYPWPRNVAGVAARPGGGFYVLIGANAAGEVSADLTSARFGFVPTGRTDPNITARSLSIGPDGGPMFGLSNGVLARGITDDPLDAASNAVTGLSEIRSLGRPASGTQVLAVGPGGLVVWSLDGAQLIARALPRDGHTSAWIDASGSEVIASSLGRADAPARFYDLTTDPIARRDLGIDTTGDWANDLDPLGRFYLQAGITNIVVDRTTLETVAELSDAGYNSFSPDGRLWAFSMVSATAVRVWDTGTWQQVSPVLDATQWTSPDDGAVPVVPVFDASGRRLLISLKTGTTVVYDTTTWQVTHVIAADDHAGAVVTRFSRDGATLVTLGTDGSIAVRDPDTYVVQRVVSGGTSAADALSNGVYIGHDGQYFVTTRDAAPRLWHLPTATLIGSFPHTSGLVAAGNDLGDRLLLTTLLGEHVLIWNLDVDSWSAIACRAAGRNLTAEEWRQFGPKDVPYQQTCPQWAAAA